MQNPTTYLAYDAALGYVQGHRACCVPKRMARSESPRNLEAQCATRLIGLVGARVRRDGGDPGTVIVAHGCDLLRALTAEQERLIDLDEIANARREVARRAIKRGEQVFHGGRAEAAIGRVHRQLISGTTAEAACACATLVDEAALVRRAARKAGRTTLVQRDVEEALRRMRTNEGLVARPSRTASRIVDAARRNGVEVPAWAEDVMADLVHFLNGWDSPLPASAFYARVAARHLGDARRAHEAYCKADEILDAARRSGGQIGGTVGRNVDGRWAARFAEHDDAIAAAEDAR